MRWSRENLERRYLDSRLGRFGKLGCIRYLPLKNQSKGSIVQSKDDEFIFPIADGTAKFSGRDYEFRVPTVRREQTVKSEDLSGESSRRIGSVLTGRTHRWRWSRADCWSIDGDFIYRHHTEPRIQLLCGEGRNIIYSTEIHWCYQVYSYLSGCVTRKEDWRLLECRFEQAFVRFVERFHEIYSIERKTSQKIYAVREEIDKSSNDYQTGLCMSRSLDENW